MVQVAVLQVEVSLLEQWTELNWGVNWVDRLLWAYSDFLVWERCLQESHGDELLLSEVFVLDDFQIESNSQVLRHFQLYFIRVIPVNIIHIQRSLFSYLIKSGIPNPNNFLKYHSKFHTIFQLEIEVLDLLILKLIQGKHKLLLLLWLCIFFRLINESHSMINWKLYFPRDIFQRLVFLAKLIVFLVPNYWF